MAFNSDEFSYKDITAVAGGRILGGLTGIKYGMKVDREYIYARGNKPRAIQDKNKTPEGEIKVLQSELRAFLKSSGTNSILDLTLDNITITYAPTGGIPVTDQLQHVKFLEEMQEMNQGDGNMEVTLPIMFLDVKYDI